MPRGRSRGRSFSPSPSFSKPTVPATRPSSNVATQSSQVPRQGPGLFGQMASTAAGVAVGSTVGHVVGGALTSGFHGNQEAPVPGPAGNAMQSPATQNPCQFEFEQFVQCAQNQHDITFCKGFNEVLKQCKIEHGLM